MKCKRAHALLSASADGRVAQGMNDSLQHHVDGCKACQAHQRSLVKIREGLGQMHSPRVPEKLALQLAVHSTQAQPKTLSWVPEFAKYALPTALAGLALAVAVFVAKPDRGPTARDEPTDVVGLSMNYESLLTDSVFSSEAQ